jgi:hypothetical protein
MPVLTNLRRLCLAMAASAAALVAAMGPAAAVKPTVARPGPVPVHCNADPVRRFEIGETTTRFGELRFLDGIEIACSGPYFGGISGLALQPDGAGFVMVSDAGLWATGRFVETGGRLSGLADVAVGPMLGKDGRALAASDDGDTESLALSEGIAYVGVEVSNKILAFDFGRDGMMARARDVEVPAAAKTLPVNRGFEALGVVPAPLAAAGALIAISERSSESEPFTVGFLIGGPMPGSLKVRRSDGFDITDLAFLPDGDMVILERRFSLLRGVAMRMRRIAGDTIRPGAVLDGPALVEAEGGRTQIDNMEALAVSRDGQGRTILTVASDDNYSYFQRSLVLRFVLEELD